MAGTILERVDEQAAETIHKISHAALGMADAIDESAGVVRRAFKRSGDVAEELMDDAAQRFKRHPAATMTTTFGLGFIAGAFICWLVTRR
jgi:hypothetical protein